MNRTQNTFRLAAIFVFLLVTSAVLALVDKSRSGDTVEDPTLRLFATLAVEDITRLSIQEPGNLVTEMLLENDRWIMQDEARTGADRSAVRNALQALCDMAQGHIVSQSGTDPDHYGVDEVSGVQVTLWGSDGAVLVHLIVGKVVDGASFVLAPADATVRRVPANLRRLLERGGIQGWRDRTVLQEGDPADVIKIDIAGAHGALSFRRDAADASAWQLTTPADQAGPAVAFRIEHMAQFMTQLQAESLYLGNLQPVDMGLEPVDYAIRAERRDGRVTEVEMGSRKILNGARPLRRRGDSKIWLIPGYEAEAFMLRPAEYRDPGDN